MTIISSYHRYVTVTSPRFSQQWTALPAFLARLHAGMAVGETVELEVAPRGERSLLAAVMAGAGFDGVELAGGFLAGGFQVAGTRARTLPDVVGPDMRALVCGLNPSLVSADAGFGYAGATNRFWASALASGLVSVARRPLDALAIDRVGITDLVKRATARSHHLAADEYTAGAARVAALVEWLRPAVVIFVGLEGWRAAVDRRAAPGWQAPLPAHGAARAHRLGGVPAYVMPSTSGANAHATPADLVGHLRAALAGA